MKATIIILLTPIIILYLKYILKQEWKSGVHFMIPLIAGGLISIVGVFIVSLISYIF